MSINDNGQQTAKLLTGVLYLYINFHATHGVELVFVSVYNNYLYKTRLCQGETETSITISSGNVVTFTANNCCRGRLYKFNNIKTT